MNMLQFYLHYMESADNCLTKLEREVLDFIKEEWNKDLEVFVELELYGIVINVFADIDFKRFEFFIIKALCEKYDCSINYRTITTYPQEDDDRVPNAEWCISLS